uniref:IF rod domain-containing protein n=1 Tax=Phocoena sinus TaxID=42100 RepID=A0A8C9BXS9_PHOSS
MVKFLYDIPKDYCSVLFVIGFLSSLFLVWIRHGLQSHPHTDEFLRHYLRHPWLPNPCLPTAAMPPAPCWGPATFLATSESAGTYGEGSLNSHEKETMQFPNDRLASYLEKVRHLERDNMELETQIQESSECHEATVCLDYQSHFCTIEELQQKILCVKSENNKLVVQIDNAKLTADDNRTK